MSLFDEGRTTFYEIDLTTGQPIAVTAPAPGSGKDTATSRRSVGRPGAGDRDRDRDVRPAR